MDITIREDFKKLIPPLTHDEYAGLEADIIANGCRDALVVWDGVLVDGHNRYEICTRHGIPFRTVEMSFESENDAKIWILKNQMSRRNLNSAQKALIAKAYENIVRYESEKKRNEAHSSENILKCKNIENDDRGIFPELHLQEVKKEQRARDVLGAIAGINGSTYEHASKVFDKAPQETIDKMLSGEISINQAYNALKLQEKQKEILQAQQHIAEQATESGNAPTLFLCDYREKLPNAQTVDLLLTDPPYSTDVDDIDAFADSWLYDALNTVKSTGFAYVFIGAYPRELRAYLNARIPEHIELCQQLIWTYKNTLGNNPKDRYKQNYQSCLFFRGVDAPDIDCPITNEQWAVMEINAPDGRQGDRYHAWQKPLEIAERMIRHSTQKGATVYDPFACTGTFLIAAAKLGRNAFGTEINADNARIAFDRGCIRG